MKSHRRAWAEIDLGAIEANARALTELAAPAALCAVVKADGYGHGAVPVARAALAGGATWLAVALVEEGVALRSAGIDAPVLLLSEPPPDAMPDVVAAELTPTLYTQRGMAALAAAAVREVAVHLKVDTGMHRVGASPSESVGLARAIDAQPNLRLEGIWTHLAVADEPENPYTSAQLERFDEVLDELAAAGLRPELVHAANTAGAVASPAARRSLVRSGIAIYGYPPSADLAGEVPLTPALSLKAEVSFVRRLAAGERVSYGLRYRLESAATLATIPLGYADGVPRRLGMTGGEALVCGKRRPIAGTITMDQLMIDCGDDDVGVGDEVVLIGGQGGQTITAEDWAARLDTISYEIVCGISVRVPRVHR